MGVLVVGSIVVGEDVGDEADGGSIGSGVVLATSMGDEVGVNEGLRVGAETSGAVEDGGVAVGLGDGRISVSPTGAVVGSTVVGANKGVCVGDTVG